MGMTITEKILAAHAGLDRVRPGDLITAKVDIALANDITAPISISRFEENGAKKVFDKDKVVLVNDHFVPNKDIKSAEQARMVRNFARAHGLTHFYDVGEMGVEHALLPEKGIVLPGDLVIGADSHTCTYGGLSAFATGMGSTDLAAAMITGETWLKVPETIRFVYTGTLEKWVGAKDLILYTIGKIGVDGALYKAMEFTGPVVQSMEMAGRLTMANMAIEAGGKNGIFAPDEITKAYAEQRAGREFTFYQSDLDAEYADTISIDVTGMEPQVAFPHLPENTKPVSQAKDVAIDQVVIGSCTNGRIEDFRAAAEILAGKKVHRDVRLILIPATPAVWRAAMDEGLFTIFTDAGGAVSTPTCGPCLGGYMGILGRGERAVSTTNRNFVGRMGHPESEVYLAGPQVAAASAIAGCIAHPDEVM